MRCSKVLFAFAAAVLVVNQFFSYPVFADEYVISGNGEGSNNNISFESDKSSTIVQENNAEINNQVETQAETGGNTADDNSGEVEITTGDIDEGTTVLNSGNTNEAEIGCCKGGPNDLGIIDNGTDSKNEIDLTQKSSNVVSISNNLSLTNNILIYADTGENEGSDNGGDVVILTGGINLLAQVLNQDLNSNRVRVSTPDISSNIKISGNGSDSKNVVNEEIVEENQFSITNSLILNNNLASFLNTGGNDAKGNKGKVFISTGSIMLDLILANRVNNNIFASGCCKKVGPGPSSSPSPSPSIVPSPSADPSPDPGVSSPSPQSSCCTPTNDPPGPPGGSGGGGSGGQVLGASLPATGGFSIWTLTFLALLMLVSGVILRSDFSYAKFRLKEVFWKFAGSFRAYTFGAYLFANLKNLYSGKA